MAAAKSSRNPFRDPPSSFRSPLGPTASPSQSEPSPPPATSSTNSSTQPGPPDPPPNASRSQSPQYPPPPGPPPTTSSSQSPAAASEANQAPSSPPPSFGLDDELPPAYTPSADVRSGEQTVEYGPRRPFQPPPTRPPDHAHALSPLPPPRPSHQQQYPTPPPRPLVSQLTGRGSGADRLGSFLTQLAELAISRTGASTSSSNSYGQANSSSYGNMPGAYPPSSSGYHTPQPQPPPPPQHPPPPQQQRYAAPPGPPPLPARPATSPSGSRPQLGASANSDFARDFYAAGAVVPGVDPDPDPRPHSPLRPTATGSPSPLQPTPTASSTRSGTNARGKPTTTPTPGHPYLHEGQLLVYPKGFECRKCHNTGYKLPSLKPCKKCWPRYGKAFTGPLVYAYEHPSEAHGGDGDGMLESSSNFQRPLPHPPPSLPHPGSSASTSSPYHQPVAPAGNSGYPGTSSRLSRIGGGFGGPALGAGPMRPMPTGSYVGRPPGGAVVYQPGDPRLGGRQCWRCGGDGWVAGLLLVDRGTCQTCGGVGRVYN